MKLPRPIPILAARRLPQGRFGGSLAGLGAVRLGVDLLAALLAEPGLDPPRRMCWGMARAHTQGMNPGRTIALRAGLPPETPGLTLNMACGSSLEALFSAARGLALGEGGPILAGGSEAMSDTPFLLPGLRWGFRLGHREVVDVMHQDGLRCHLTGLLMGETIEVLARRHGVGRVEADAYALESHRRAAAADFSAERIPHPRLTEDECIRRDLTLERLADLPPVFDPSGQVTAGNASALSDGAAAMLLGQPDDGPGLARILAWAEAGVAPLDMGWAPVPAVRTLLVETGLSRRDIALWELNEAFAAQVLVCARDLDLPLDRLNVAGGSVSLGHPIGASGVRILVTLVHQLRQRGGGLGIATLGIGGGLGQAVLVEV